MVGSRAVATRRGTVMRMHASLRGLRFARQLRGGILRGLDDILHMHKHLRARVLPGWIHRGIGGYDVQRPDDQRESKMLMTIGSSLKMMN